MGIDVEDLIKQVFTRSVLWDQSNKHYHNRIIIDKNWQCVEKAMKIPKELLKKKWKSIRDQFRNELRKIPKGNSDEPYESYITWPHFKSLLFLKDQMKTRKPIPNFYVAENLTEEPTEERFDDSFSESYDEVVPDMEDVSFKHVSKKPKVISHTADEILALEQRKLELLERKENYPKEQRDYDVAFFESLIPYMKTMDMHQKMLCRMDIQRTVYNYAFHVTTNTAPVSQSTNEQDTSFSADSKLSIINVIGEPK